MTYQLLKELKWQLLKWLPIGRFGGGKVVTSKKEGSQQESVREPVQSMKGRMKEGMNRGPASLFDGGAPSTCPGLPGHPPQPHREFSSISFRFPRISAESLAGNGRSREAA